MANNKEITQLTSPTRLLSLAGRHIGIMFGWGSWFLEHLDRISSLHAHTDLVVDRAVVHFKKRNVVFVGELVKVSVCDHFPDLAVDMAVSLVRVQHMVLPYPHQQVTGGNVLKSIHRCLYMI